MDSIFTCWHLSVGCLGENLSLEGLGWAETGLGLVCMPMSNLVEEQILPRVQVKPVIGSQLERWTRDLLVGYLNSLSPYRD